MVDAYGRKPDVPREHGTANRGRGDVGQLGAQMVHLVVGFLWAWALGWGLFTIAKRFMQIRVSPEAEIAGLDVPEFGALAYPDFVTHHAQPGHVLEGAVDVAAVAPRGEGEEA